jgi:peptide/nickel transport system substrate-binding protein
VPEEFTRIAMLRTGEVDILRLSREKVKEVLDAGLNVLVKENANMISFTPNMQWASPVFSDIRFRKALNLAIDKEAIIKRILDGRAKPTINYPGMNLLACGGDPTLKPYPYNPEEARRLIREGGWEGHEFVVPSYTRGAAPELPSMIETVCSYWEKIGLKPKIVNLEWLTWRQTMRSQKTPNNIHGNAYAVDPECASLLNRLRLIYHSKSDQTVVKIPEIDQMIERAEKSLDKAEVSRLIGDVHRYVHQQDIDIPICELSQDIATTKRVPKWDPGQRRMGSNINDVIRQR